ncbi:MAG: hypothetical protein ACYC6Y_29805, partial [Thermoguttaceae bacterium]
DYEIQRCSRRCAATEREFSPGEEFFSVLIAEGAELRRLDYSAEAWKGPPDHATGWWRCRMPSASQKQMHWAPNDVLLHFFEELENKPERADMRFVLGLLLVRRRVLREDDRTRDEQGRETTVLFCPRNDKSYSVPTVLPAAARIAEIQEELAQLLFAKAD